MIDQALLTLQNGSDIRGVATEGIIGQSVTLTTDIVAKLCRGFLTWLGLHKSAGNGSSSPHLRIAVGMDARLTGPTLAQAAQTSITEAGADVLFCGLASTPSMLYSTIKAIDGAEETVGADGSIMFTGSHMGFNRNGMKFFSAGVEVEKNDLTEIIRLASEPAEKQLEKGEVHICNILSIYSKHLCEKVRNALKEIADDPKRPLSGLKVVVDAGNGAGGFFVRRILQPLGADTTGSQVLTPDGRLPNHTPDPEDYEAMRSISTAVILAGADLGIIFDADVDRVAIVDEDGRAINRNEFVALASAITLEEHPHTSIVTDSITSNGITTFIQDILGAHQCRYQRGYRNVINEAIHKNENGAPTWLAVETSGHAAFKENSFCDDGAYFAIKILIKLAQLKKSGKKLYSLIEQLPVPAESKEFRMDILDPDFARAASTTLDGLRQFVSQTPEWEEVSENHEGLRVMCNGEDERGWFLFRLSLHSPEMPLNIEADKKGGAQNIINKLKLFFRTCKAIDSTVLYN